MGGEYPIVSAHVLFGERDALDPRYQYATLVREPVDRAISWLHFVRNMPRERVPELHDACLTYLDSEGDILLPPLESHLPNLAVAHYAPILGTFGLNDEQRVESAFRAIRSYDCVGIYERLKDFVADHAVLIGIPAPESLAQINVTGERPKVDAISAKLRDNISRVTQLDQKLYHLVAELVERRLAVHPPHPPTNSRWARYDRT